MSEKMFNRSVEGAADVVNLDTWRTHKEQSFEKAQKKICKIEGFDNLSAGAQVIKLAELKEELAADNSNRFVDKVLAAEIKMRMDTLGDADRLEYKLPLRSPRDHAMARGESAQGKSEMPTTPPEWYSKLVGYELKPGDQSPVGAEWPSNDDRPPQPAAS